MAHTKHEIDGYWGKMADLMIEAMSGLLRSDLSDSEKTIASGYVAEALDNAYEMGIRLGGLKERLEQRLEKSMTAEKLSS